MFCINAQLVTGVSELSCVLLSRGFYSQEVELEQKKMAAAAEKKDFVDEENRSVDEKATVAESAEEEEAAAAAAAAAARGFLGADGGSSGDESKGDEDVAAAVPAPAERDEGEDEAARRALLRAAQLKATGVDPAGSGRNGNGGGGGGGDGDERNEFLDALGDLVREYFSVDFIEDESGGKEMVVMTSPEFIGFLLIAIILSGRFGHWLVNTYLVTPVDPLLR